MTGSYFEWTPGVLFGILSLFTAAAAAASPPPPPVRVPVVDVTDLYHPPQDPGDNFDLLAAYGLPEIDLRAVILDCTGRYRRRKTEEDPVMRDDGGPRDPGFVPVLQLNYLFDRDVPCAAAPFEPMRSPEDRMDDTPEFQQAGVRLLLATLRESPGPVEIVSFGSARPVAVAWNREPDLLRRKVRRISLCAGSAPAGFPEWNVQLDRQAFVRLLRSDLPVAIYPCAAEKGPFDVGRNNTFWNLPDLGFLRDMDPRLARYLLYAFGREVRSDFLRAMDEAPAGEALRAAAARSHSVWETAVWADVAGRRLVRRPGDAWRLVPAADVRPGDEVLPEGLRPCRVRVRDDGRFDFEITTEPANFRIYERPDPAAVQAACREALPALYRSFRVPTPGVAR